MRRWLGVTLLGFAVIFSAVVLVVSKHGNRELVGDLDDLRVQRAGLEVEHLQLRLEEGALAHPGQIEQTAEQGFGMTEPDAAVVVGGTR